MVNTSKVNATSYHLGCDGLVECFNHTLTTILSMYVSEHQTDWDHFIPYALFAYRTSVQSSTRETPFLYGRDPRLPSDASLLKAQETYQDTNDYRSVLADRFVEARKLAHDIIELAQQHQKEYYDHKAKYICYNVGDRVWLYTPNKTKGLSSKLTHNWHGPYWILSKTSLVNYVLDANDERSVTQIVRVNCLKPFIYKDIRPDTPTDGQIEGPDIDESHSNEDESTNDDYQDELAVKAILSKTIIKNRLVAERHYLVQWEDEEIEPSWEPLRNVHCGELLKQFELSLLSKTTN